MAHCIPTVFMYPPSPYTPCMCSPMSNAFVHIKFQIPKNTQYDGIDLNKRDTVDAGVQTIVSFDPSYLNAYGESEGEQISPQMSASPTAEKDDGEAQSLKSVELLEDNDYDKSTTEINNASINKLIEGANQPNVRRTETSVTDSRRNSLNKKSTTSINESTKSEEKPSSAQEEAAETLDSRKESFHRKSTTNINESTKSEEQPSSAPEEAAETLDSTIKSLHKKSMTDINESTRSEEKPNSAQEETAETLDSRIKSLHKKSTTSINESTKSKEKSSSAREEEAAEILDTEISTQGKAEYPQPLPDAETVNNVSSTKPSSILKASDEPRRSSNAGAKTRRLKFEPINHTALTGTKSKYIPSRNQNPKQCIDNKTPRMADRKGGSSRKLVEPFVITKSNVNVGARKSVVTKGVAVTKNNKPKKEKAGNAVKTAGRSSAPKAQTDLKKPSKVLSKATKQARTSQISKKVDALTEQKSTAYPSSWPRSCEKEKSNGKQPKKPLSFQCYAIPHGCVANSRFCGKPWICAHCCDQLPHM